MLQDIPKVALDVDPVILIVVIALILAAAYFMEKKPKMRPKRHKR